jgi:hypothetical protein
VPMRLGFLPHRRRSRERAGGSGGLLSMRYQNRYPSSPPTHSLPMYVRRTTVPALDQFCGQRR